MREPFLLDRDVVFLNHGSYGACPRPVFERYQAWQLELERQPVEFLGRRGQGLLFDARRALAEYVGASVDHLVFALNATSALSTALHSLELGPGDEVLTTDHEYGAIHLALDWTARRGQARVVRVGLDLPLEEAAAVDAVWAAVSERTRVLLVSHITSRTAVRLPVEELCRRAAAAGIVAIVDGAHAPGQIDLSLDNLGAAVYAGNCHKWLCGPKGAAFLHVHPDLHDLVEPLVIGWGHEGEPAFAERHELRATQDIAAYLSIPAAIEFVREHGRGKESRALLRDAGRRLAAAGYEPTGPLGSLQMAAFRVPECDPKELQRRLLEEHGIEVAVTAWRGKPLVRVSVAAYTTPGDLARLETALSEVF